MSWLWANEPGGALPASWYAETAPPIGRFPAFSGDLRCDTAVIGAGYTGLSAALHLAQAGRDVVVLEAAQVGFGASGRNGGQVGSGFRWEPDALARRLGLAEAQALWQQAEDAKALVRDLCRRHAPEADYRSGILYAVSSARDLDDAHREAERTASLTGYADLTPVDAAEARHLTGSAGYAGGILDKGAGQIQPLAFARGLARAVVAAGARIHEATRVQRLRPGAPHVLETAAGRIRADHVILGCNGYLDGLHSRVADHVLPINNYIAATEPLGARAPMGAGAKGQTHAVADDRFVVNYWWQSRDGRLIFGGGESYGQRFPRDIAAKVRANLARVYPELAEVRFTHAWGGTLAVTASRLPYAAELAPGLLTVGGYSGHGVALATAAGQAMARHVLGEGADFARLTTLPVPRLPGGRWFGPLITNGALMTLALRDRLGV